MIIEVGEDCFGIGTYGFFEIVLHRNGSEFLGKDNGFLFWWSN